MWNNDIVRVITLRTVRDLCNDIHTFCGTCLHGTLMCYIIHLISTTHVPQACAYARQLCYHRIMSIITKVANCTSIITRTISRFDTLLPSHYILLILHISRVASFSSLTNERNDDLLSCWFSSIPLSERSKVCTKEGRKSSVVSQLYKPHF